MATSQYLLNNLSQSSLNCFNNLHSIVVFGISPRGVILIKTTLNTLYSISVSSCRFLYLCSLYSQAFVVLRSQQIVHSIAYISPLLVTIQAAGPCCLNRTMGILNPIRSAYSLSSLLTATDR